MNAPIASTAGFRILSLDGGGAKGFYSIGVLKEIEAMLGGGPLCDQFDLVFGTSTGAIIAALVVLGYKVDEIHGLYRQHVPAVMGRWLPISKSRELRRLADDVFGNKTFSEAKTRIGIVATHWMLERPLIFKSHADQAHGRAATFVPGLGQTIANAVRASCSAYPFFARTMLKTTKGENVRMIDGGFCANNPTLYAIAEATTALKKVPTELRVVSIGVGVYPEPRRWGHSWLIRRFLSVKLLQKTLNINTASMDQLRVILCGDVPTVRLNDTFDQPEMATDLMESNLRKLDLLYQRGGETFAKHEKDLLAMLGGPRLREGIA
jgi:predicted patatin/cPLA2 family phospholipase